MESKKKKKEWEQGREIVQGQVEDEKVSEAGIKED